MKITVITGSPNQNGNSAKLVEAFTDESRKMGNDVTVFNTAFMKIAGCRHCGKCYTLGRPCVMNDDFNTIANAIDVSNAVVLASPLYWGSFTSQIKACIDRFACFYYSRHYSPKKCALIACCQGKSVITYDTGFSGMISTYLGIVQILSGVHVGMVLVPHVLDNDDILKTDGLKQARELAKLF